MTTYSVHTIYNYRSELRRLELIVETTADEEVKRKAQQRINTLRARLGEQLDAPDKRFKDNKEQEVQQPSVQFSSEVAEQRAARIKKEAEDRLRRMINEEGGDHEQ